MTHGRSVVWDVSHINRKILRKPKGGGERQQSLGSQDFQTVRASVAIEFSLHDFSKNVQLCVQQFVQQNFGILNISLIYMM